MLVKELIEKLQELPQDLKIWVSDGGYAEGATPLTKIEVVNASGSGLDGDEIDDELYFAEDCNSEEMLKRGYELIENGCDFWSKKIVLIKTKLD